MPPVLLEERQLRIRNLDCPAASLRQTNSGLGGPPRHPRGSHAGLHDESVAVGGFGWRRGSSVCDPPVYAATASTDNLSKYRKDNLFLRVLEEVELPDVRLVAGGYAPVRGGPEGPCKVGPPFESVGAMAAGR